jgi:hypothetical protein
MRKIGLQGTCKVAFTGMMKQKENENPSIFSISCAGKFASLADCAADSRPQALKHSSSPFRSQAMRLPPSALKGLLPTQGTSMAEARTRLAGSE